MNDINVFYFKWKEYFLTKKAKSLRYCFLAFYYCFLASCISPVFLTQIDRCGGCMLYQPESENSLKLVILNNYLTQHLNPKHQRKLINPYTNAIIKNICIYMYRLYICKFCKMSIYTHLLILKYMFFVFILTILWTFFFKSRVPEHNPENWNNKHKTTRAQLYWNLSKPNFK